MPPQAYHSVAMTLLCGVAFAVMVRLRDMKYNVLPCSLCGKRGKHKLDCPGSR